MADTFDEHLERVSGKIRRIKSSRYNLQKEALLGYSNSADNLRSGALIIWNAYHEGCVGPQSLGFEAGFSFSVSLPPVFSLLCGLSIELLLKGTCKALELPAKKHHRLADLADDAGIVFSDDDRVILLSLTEYVYWAGRYPAPNDEKGWFAAEEIFSQQKRSGGSLADYSIQTREINRSNYDRLWKHFSSYFWKAKEAVLESVEFSRE
jgi:hypothetical protein